MKNAVLDGHIDNESLRMIEGVFRVSEVQVRDIMIPRPHMTVIDIADQIDEIIKKVASSGHSRFPVIDDNRDEIIGVLLAKDLLKRSISDDNDDLDSHHHRKIIAINSLQFGNGVTATKGRRKEGHQVNQKSVRKFPSQLLPGSF